MGLLSDPKNVNSGLRVVCAMNSTVVPAAVVVGAAVVVVVVVVDALLMADSLGLNLFLLGTLTALNLGFSFSASPTSLFSSL